MSVQLYKLVKTDKLLSLNVLNAKRTNNKGRCCPAWKHLHDLAFVHAANVPIIQSRMK